MPATSMAQKQEQYLRVAQPTSSEPVVVPVSDRDQASGKFKDSDQETQIDMPIGPTLKSPTECLSLDTSFHGSSPSWHRIKARTQSITDTKVAQSEVSPKEVIGTANKSTAPFTRSLRTVSTARQPTDLVEQASAIRPSDAQARPELVTIHNSTSQPPIALNSIHALAGTGAAPGQSSNLPQDTGPSLRPDAQSIPQEPFSAIDTETRTGAPVWTNAGSNKVEAGFQDSTLGWVSVRAQLDSTGVHATVVPASREASQTLINHLSGAVAYLSEHHAHVESLTLARPESPGLASTLTQTGNQGTLQGGGQDQGSSQSSEATDGNGTSFDASVCRGEEMPEPTEATLFSFADKGQHISLVA